MSIHRGLGVHISFVRSITMDSFKNAEVARMKYGGNKPWREFFDAHESNKMAGTTFDDSTIQDRYDSEAGEEWKERLTAKVEGKEYVPGARSSVPVRRAPKKDGAAISGAGSRSQTPLERVSSHASRSTSPSLGTSSLGASGSKKAQNEAYFAKMGSQNASRPDDLPPNQGGKFAGFGSEPMPTRNENQGVLPGVDDFQKDPVAALTKGIGWLSSTVGKQAKTGYEGWVKPNMQKLAEADLATQARLTAAQLGQNLQHSTKNAAETFSKFVEGSDSLSEPSGAHNAGRSHVEPEKKDFWDSFGDAPKGPTKDKKEFWDDFAAAGEAVKSKAKPTSIGTSAMKKPSGAAGASGAAGGKKEDDGWGEW
ncbi:hypothetical protein LTR04_005781 [Oleoguttula sp. CCFEE 6159]|nr:hypothetical protein LTR04_005781 [Oleoguttula sp. CCFEE 6159]